MFLNDYSRYVPSELPRARAGLCRHDRQIANSAADGPPGARLPPRSKRAGLCTSAGSSRSEFEAFRLFSQGKPHLLVSDISMPHRDGYDLIRQIRSLETVDRMPAIALTAFARSEDRQRAFRAGFQTHVSKPVEPAELIAVVASLTGRNDLQSSATVPEQRQR